METDTSFRFNIPTDLLRAAHEQAKREDLTLAQVLRRFLVAWVNGSIKVPELEPLRPKRREKRIE